MSFHDKRGKFCKATRAHTKSVDGQHYRIVRSHRRIGPNGKEIRVKRGAKKEEPAMEETQFDYIGAAKARSEHVMGLLGKDIVSIDEAWSPEARAAAAKTRKGGGAPRVRDTTASRNIKKKNTTPEQRDAQRTKHVDAIRSSQTRGRRARRMARG